MPRLSRRRILGGTALLTFGASSSGLTAQPRLAGGADVRLADLERRHGGRLGVAILNLASGTRVAHRADERFLLLSTFKTLLAACVLARVDQGKDALDRRIAVSERDLIDWAPVTGKRLGPNGMTVAELCEATVTLSDNPAANILLASVGGPPALTAFLRLTGDTTTRLDRTEPTLNERASVDDPRDSTTPAAMLETMQKLFFGDVLSKHSRSQLVAWHIANKTGDQRLRAGMPATWLVADKTGTNRSGTSNDVGVAWPVDRGPVLVTAYCEMPAATGDQRNAVIADVGRIAAGIV